MAYKHAIPVCGAIILNETLNKVESNGNILLSHLIHIYVQIISVYL